MDTKAFHALSYGMYIVSAAAGAARSGCVINTLEQVTSKPARMSIAINKENYTSRIIKEAGRFAASVLSVDVDGRMIGDFGFNTSTEFDAFTAWPFETDDAGMPYVTEGICASVSVVVREVIDAGTHLVFIGDVERAEVVEDAAEPMTYAYYHQVKGGKTPSKASVYVEDETAAGFSGDAAESDNEESSSEDSSGAKSTQNKTRIAWRCKMCGYIEYVDELPDDFRCPICGATRDNFERIEVPA